MKAKQRDCSVMDGNGGYITAKFMGIWQTSSISEQGSTLYYPVALVEIVETGEVKEVLPRQIKFTNRF